MLFTAIALAATIYHKCFKSQFLLTVGRLQGVCMCLLLPTPIKSVVKIALPHTHIKIKIDCFHRCGAKLFIFFLLHLFANFFMYVAYVSVCKPERN